jgi:hypothetical protein
MRHHATADTSRESFHSLGVSTYLQPKERAILAAFHDQTTKLTRKDLARITGMELSAVCGRVNSLLTKRELEVVGKTRDIRTGKAQEVLSLPKLQMELLA